MSNPVIGTAKKAAVRVVKPLVGPRAWARLKGGAPAPPATPAAPPAARRTPPQAKAEPKAELTEAQRRRRELQAMSLTELAQHFGTDKHGLHFYTAHYQRHLEHLRGERFTLLEIGIGGYVRQGRGGASLRMWKFFFPKAQVIGLDIEDKSFVRAPRIDTYQGSQVDPEVLERIVAEKKGPLRVVIDDGSHRPEHIRETFRILFPLLEDGGIYAIEDTQTSYWPEWGGSEDRHDPTTTMALVKDLVDGLNHEEYVDESYVPTYADLHVVAVHCYHNLVFIEKGSNTEGTNRRSVLAERYAGTPDTTDTADPQA
ncbi:CmcI family methyltransferase [Nocardioides psychrotolerans]|uniref:CmcI family methyltransferase n=1 Tax=Nocardioides psychrotolerans TaxID=1005945 RepID=UPI003137A6F2